MPTTQSPECSPQEAIQGYLALGGEPGMGDVPVAQLEVWRHAIKAVRLTPEQRFHAGWMSVDHAWSLYDPNMTSEDFQAATTPLIRESDMYFDGVIKDKASDRLLKMQAAVSRAGLVAHHAISCGQTDLVEQKYGASSKQYARVAEQMLAEYQREGDLSYVPHLQSLTMTMLFHSLPNHQIFALPAPSRAHHIPDGQATWSLLLADCYRREHYALRVGEESPKNDIFSLSPTAMENETYPAKHGQGLLQAILDRHKKLPHHDYRRNRLASYGPADDHVQRIGGGIVKALRTKKTTTLAPSEQLADNSDDPIATYRSMHTGRYVGWLDDKKLEQMIESLEPIYVDRRQKMPAGDKRAYAWIQLESAIETGLSGRPAVALDGQFDHAEDIMHRAAETFERQGDRAGFYTAKLERAALPVYRAIAQETNEMDMDAVVQTYRQQLVELAVALLDERGCADPGSTFGRDVAKAAHELAACLSLSSEDGAFLATPATLRQRHRGEDDLGWDITIWPLSQKGFRPDYYGKIRIDDAADRFSIDKGIVTIPKADFDKDTSYGVLWNLAAQAQQMDIEPEAQAYLDDLFKRLASANDLIV